MDAQRTSPSLVRLLLAARALRAFADGFVVVLLPAYLLALGHGELAVGFLSTATLFGSAMLTLAVGRWGYRFPMRGLMLGAATLMIVAGLGFATLSSLWPLLVVACMSPMNPSGSDVSVFLPLEQTALATAVPGDRRTTIFARYSFIGSMFGAVGALAAAVPDWLTARAGLTLVDALKAMFFVYAAIGATVWALYLRVPRAHADDGKPAVPLGPSRGIVFRLAGLFSIDSFGGGLVANALIALWLFERFGMSLTAAGAFFFWTGLLGATSQLVAPLLARRIGLINTMVFTHVPSNFCFIGAAFASSLEVALAFLLVRAALGQMDVPVRTAYVMSVVTPAERPAAASFTAVPRSLAASIGPSLTGAMFAAGAMAAPLVMAGVLKTAYDIALFAAFRRIRPRD